jgi:beta-galactosidase
MGNSNGTLKEYWDAIHTYEGLQGGFIWEFWDHAINQVLPDGRIRSAYGGDFGETRHDGSFVCDGMFWADRTPKPAMYEMKLIASPIDVLSANPDSLKFTVHNKLFFTDTSNYELKWQLTVEGDVVEEGHIKLGKIDPRGKKAIALQFKKMKYSGEKLITFTVARKGATAWANAGAPIGEFQFKLASQPREELSKKSSPALESLVSKDGDILLPYGKKAPQLTLFRAPTENDIYGHIAPKWRKWGLRELTQKSIKTELGKNKAEISRIWETSTGIKVHHHQRIKVIPGGFKVSEEITIPKSLDDLPRVGISFEIDSALEDFTYFGSGPVETYPDRKMSPIRKVVSTVNDQYIPYVVPQESGGHSSVRWFELSNEFGEKIRIEFNNPLQVSALPYSAAEFDSKSHDIDLVKSENTVVTIDAIHRGVGTASCGPDTLPRYLIKPGVYKFSWTFTVVSN